MPDQPDRAPGTERAPGASEPPEADREPESGGDEEREHEPPRPALSLPLLSGGAEIGLGDVIKRATTAMHLPPCRGCQRRAAVLNRVVFRPVRRRG